MERRDLPPLVVRFTRNAATGTSPLITAAAAADGDFWWQGPGGGFVGKQPDISNFPAGNYLLRSAAWSLATTIDFSDRKLTSLDMRSVLRRTKALLILKANNNSGLVIPLAFLTPMPPSLSYYWINDTGIVGDISALVPVSPTISYLYLHNNASLTGDIASLAPLPTTCSQFHIEATGVTGDITSLAPIRSGMAYFVVGSTAISGDVSLMGTLPTNLLTFNLYSTTVTYGTGSSLATLSGNGKILRFDNCSWTTAMVDRALADCVTSATTGSTLNLGGTGSTKNGIPTGGVNNANYLTLVARGWTVTITTS